MKRLITFLFLFVLLLGVAVLSYSFIPGFSNIPYMGAGVKNIKKHTALVVLFKKKFGLEDRQAYYRFYSDGKWQPLHDFQQELFDAYTTGANYGALQHCRLDAFIVWFVLKEGKKHPNNIKTNKNYIFLKQHLLFAHSSEVKPDSLELFFYQSSNHIDKELVLTIKDTL